MNKLQLVPALLLLALAATPMAGQAIPDGIPDLPGESPADREKERAKERYHGTLSRLFTTGSFDLAPVTGDGSAYQANLNLGYNLGSGDAVFVFMSRRNVLADWNRDVALPGGLESASYYGLGYELAGARFLGASSLARRSALNLGLGVMRGELSSVALDVTPTYDLLNGDFWSVPAGLKVSLISVGSADASMSRAFLGFTVGVKRRFGHRERLELK